MLLGVYCELSGALRSTKLGFEIRVIKILGFFDRHIWVSTFFFLGQVWPKKNVKGWPKKDVK